MAVEITGAGGQPASMNGGVARAGARHASLLTVRTIVYPRENGRE